MSQFVLAMDQWPPPEAQPFPEQTFSQDAQSPLTQYSIASTASSDAPLATVMSVAVFFKTPFLSQMTVDNDPQDLLKPGIFIIYTVQNNKFVRLFSVGAHDDVFCAVRTLLPSFGIAPPSKRLVLCNIVTNSLFLENNQTPDPHVWSDEFAAFTLLHI